MRLPVRRVFWLGRASRISRVVRLAFPALRPVAALRHAGRTPSQRRDRTGFSPVSPNPAGRSLWHARRSPGGRIEAIGTVPAVIRIVLACVLYLTVVMAWAAERLDD